MVFPAVYFAIAAYVFGSIPFGKLIAAQVARIDITRRGSGNIGATNVAREVGIKWGIATLILDVLKSLGPMVAFSFCASGSGTAHHIALAGIGLCALLGHMFPLFLKFKGGKGVATALGIYLGLSPISCLFGMILFVVVVAIWGFISLGSLISACAMPVILMIFGTPWPLIGASALVSILICWKHKENIRRLFREEEPRWKERKHQTKSSISLSSSSSE